MNPFEQFLRDMAEKAESKNRFGHLTHEQNVDRTMECNRVFWKHITFNTLPDGDERGRDMQQLLLTMRTMDMAQYHVTHMLTDEDEAPRKESKLRCEFWPEHHKMIVRTAAYAEYCGYITIDHAACDKEIDEIEAQYEALKPVGSDTARTDAQTDNEAE